MAPHTHGGCMGMLLVGGERRVATGPKGLGLTIPTFAHGDEMLSWPTNLLTNLPPHLPYPLTDGAGLAAGGSSNSTAYAIYIGRLVADVGPDTRGRHYLWAPLVPG